MPSARGPVDRDDADVVEHRLAAVGDAAGEVDLELAGQALRVGVAEEVAEGGLGPRRDVEHLVGAGAGEVAPLHVAHGVAAGLARRQADRGHVAQQRGDALELDEVELDVLPGRDVAPPARVLVGEVAAHVELLGGEGAVRHLDAHHLVVAALALPVDAVVEAEDAEAVLVELAVEVEAEHALELLDVGEGLRLDGAGADLSRDRLAHGGLLQDGRGGRSGGGAKGSGQRVRLSSSRTRWGVTPSVTDGAPSRRRSIVRLALIEDQSTIPDESDQVLALSGRATPPERLGALGEGRPRFSRGAAARRPETPGRATAGR